MQAARRRWSRSVLIVMVVLVLPPAGTSCGRDEASSSEGASSSTAPMRLTAIARMENEFGRVSGVDVDDVGRVYVADAMANTITVFSAGGDVLRTLGRPGDGPGEFRWLRQIAVHGESLYAFDLDLQRVTIFPQADTGRVSVVSVNDPHTFRVAQQPLLVDRAGAMVLRYTKSTVTNAAADPDQNALVRRLDAAGKVVEDSLALLHDTEWLITKGRSGLHVSDMPFGKTSHMALLPSGDLIVAWSGTPGLDIFRRGRLLKRISIPVEIRAVESADVDSLRHSTAVSAGFLKDFAVKRLTKAYQEGQLPSTYPWVLGLTVDDAGNAWVTLLTAKHFLQHTNDGLEYRSGGESSIARVGSDGTLAQQFLLDAGAVLLRVRAGRMYALVTREDGSQYIAVYEVPKEVG